MDIINYAKEHPWTIAAVAGGGLILYYLYASTQNASTAVTYAPGTDPATQQLNAQLAAQTQALQYQFAGQQNQLNASVAIATLQANTQVQTAELGRDVSLAGIQAQENVQVSGQQSQVQIAQLASEANIAQINASRDVSIAQGATYAEIAQVNAATQLGIAQTASAAQVATAQYGLISTALQVAGGGKDANLNVSLPGGGAINYSQYRPYTGSSGGTNWGSIIGGVGSAIGALFSDVRLKENIVMVDRLASGLNVYEFNYIGCKERYRGLLAQEVIEIFPSAVELDPTGFYKVDYLKTGYALKRVN